MQNDLTQESLDNKKTLDFLIELTEMLSKSNAFIGRNEYMFAVDVTKLPKLFSDDGKEVARFFNTTKLFMNHEIAFGFKEIASICFISGNILFIELSKVITIKDNQNEEKYPYLSDIQNWFLKIPLFSKIDKVKFEQIYKKTNAEADEYLNENSDEILDSIFK